MLNRALGLAPLFGAIAGVAAALLVSAASARHLGEVALRAPPQYRAEVARGWIPTLQPALVVFVGYGALAGAAVRTLRSRAAGEPVVRSQRLWMRVLPVVAFLSAVTIVTLFDACAEIPNRQGVRWWALGRGPFLTLAIVLKVFFHIPVLVRPVVPAALVTLAAIVAIPAYVAFARNVRRLPAAAMWILGAIAIVILTSVPLLAAIGLPVLIAD